MIQVIIPAYNRPDCLENALWSLVVQTKKQFITIVIDDASQEDLLPIVNKFSERLHIVYCKLPENGGPGPARQKGIEIAANMNIEYIMFLDSDDMYYPNTVERLHYEIAHSGTNLVAQDIVAEHKNQPTSVITSSNLAFRTWTHGKIYRLRYILEKNINFPKEVKYNEDLCFNNQAYWNTDNKAFLPEPLYLWRDDENSITRKNRKEFKPENLKGWIKATTYQINHLIENKGDVKQTLIDLIGCYSYYEQCLAYTDKIDLSDIDEKLTAILKNPQYVECFKNPKIMAAVRHGLAQYQVEEDEIYYFPQTFITWLIDHGYNPDLCEEDEEEEATNEDSNS